MVNKLHSKVEPLVGLRDWVEFNDIGMGDVRHYFGLFTQEVNLRFLHRVLLNYFDGIFVFVGKVDALVHLPEGSLAQLSGDTEHLSHLVLQGNL